MFNYFYFILINLLLSDFNCYHRKFLLKYTQIIKLTYVIDIIVDRG